MSTERDNRPWGSRDRDAEHYRAVNRAMLWSDVLAVIALSAFGGILGTVIFHLGRYFLFGGR